MAKVSYMAYMKPLIKAYERPKFLGQSEILLPFIKQTSLRNISCFENKHWIYVNQRLAMTGHWIPKIYICVKPQYFWATVSDLISLSQSKKFGWKFCRNLKLFARPDKIVIYAQDASHLKKIVRSLRPLLKGREFHEIHFASRTVESGLEKKGDGIYVGADPQFLEAKVSWRYYRWVIEEAIIKPNRHNRKLDKKLLKALNVSLRHQGPLSLKPSSKYNSFVKELWKEITS